MNRTAAIILNYNSYQDTIKCITNLYKINAEVDVVVVDNASTNNSIEMINDAFIGKENFYLLENNKNTGYAAGNNIGLKFASDKLTHVEFMCIMNPDTIIDTPDVIRRLEAALDKKEIYAVAAPVIKQNGILDYCNAAWKIPSGFRFGLMQLMFFNQNATYKKISQNGIHEVEAVHGSFFMIKKKVLLEIGFLDEHTFMYWEETLLGLQLKKIGYKEILLTSDYYCHNHPKRDKNKRITLKQRIRTDIEGNTRSRLYICHQYYSVLSLLFLYVMIFVELLYLCFLQSRHDLINQIGKIELKRNYKCD